MMCVSKRQKVKVKVVGYHHPSISLASRCGNVPRLRAQAVAKNQRSKEAADSSYVCSFSAIAA
eukprot:scaffold24143_cov146-Isochrysis_galbana.AAC.7